LKPAIRCGLRLQRKAEYADGEYAYRSYKFPHHNLPLEDQTLLIDIQALSQITNGDAQSHLGNFSRERSSTLALS
jgi:hypothetical protein